MIRDGADVLIPGEAPLCVLLASQGISRVDNVPILDALTVTMKMAELFADLWRLTGVRPSRDNYFTASPAPQRVRELLRFYGIDRLMPGGNA